VIIGSAQIVNDMNASYIVTARLDGDRFATFINDLDDNSDLTSYVVTRTGELGISVGPGVKPEPVKIGSYAHHFDAQSMSSSGFVIAYEKQEGVDNDKGFVKAASVDGTTITYGSGVEFVDSTDRLSMGYVAPDKFMLLYKRQSGDNKTYCRVGSVSGVTITLGSAVEVASEVSDHQDIAMMEDDKVMIQYRGTGTNRPFVHVVTVSGLTPTVGSGYELHSGETWWSRVYRYNADTFISVFRDNVLGVFDGTIVSGTVSGTTITLGSEYVFDDGTIDDPHLCIPPTGSSFDIVYEDSGDGGKLKAKQATIIGNTFVLGNVKTIEEDNIDSNATTWLQDYLHVVSYTNQTDGNDPTVRFLWNQRTLASSCRPND